ncbi:hypothetical protein [Amycolatopsis cihanbeyliensis]|uniref:Mce-associated membrane protein n=1 Tax=Amycolatopsis cihanbeyliensis TaxID=1128664 RepID=A0A542DFU1_AMYCI|nr:hypothetical protein [Amycolatopsis cihanbeyliensis]TQJ01922.1 Mce-associated membrane protein [Amycolatopsis cihanbeyliensis]
MNPAKLAKPESRASLLAVLAAVLVLATGCAVWFAFEAATLRSGDPETGDPEANAALVDVPATEEVTEQVGAAVKAIFSYDYNNFARTERAASRVLVGEAVEQYQASFAAARKQATEQRLVRSTTIRAIGVRELRGDQARVLVFLDQQTLRAGDNREDPTTAHLDILAKHVAGQWKIATLAAL